MCQNYNKLDRGSVYMAPLHRQGGYTDGKVLLRSVIDGF